MKSVQFTHSYTPASVQAIEKFEQILGYHLPSSYKNFLLTYNGGHPIPSGFTFGEQGKEYSVAEWLFGLHTEPYNNLAKEWGIYRERVPEGFLPIGTDPGGNLLLLCVTGNARGAVFFWDHEEENSVGEPTTQDNIYPVAESFTSFLKGLIDFVD